MSSKTSETTTAAIEKDDSEFSDLSEDENIDGISDISDEDIDVSKIYNFKASFSW